MVEKIKGVSTKIHPTFFDNQFEKTRKILEKQLKTTLSQMKFTEYLAKNNAKIILPKRRKL